MKIVLGTLHKEDYITLDMFKAIQKLSIDKPSIFDIISNTYFNYKNELQIIKELTVYKQFIAEQKKGEILRLFLVED